MVQRVDPKALSRSPMDLFLLHVQCVFTGAGVCSTEKSLAPVVPHLLTDQLHLNSFLVLELCFLLYSIPGLGGSRQSQCVLPGPYWCTPVSPSTNPKHALLSSATLSSSSLTRIWRKMPIQVTAALSCCRSMAPMFSQSFWMRETTSSQLNSGQTT